MTYQEATDFLFSALPMYQRVGKKALKIDLNNILRLCESLGNPQEQFKTVHVAGTNGKGSSSHMLASVLQEAGYKTGLYTSPHLKSFTERIRIDGSAISETGVVDFVENHKQVIKDIQPSFFEMTVAMAFEHFAKEQVDIAVIEVGLGGRLDSTNIITPEVSLITNIGLDHTDILGDTLAEIAYEKAGIIKAGIPVAIGTWQEETVPVFEKLAKERNTNLYHADRPGEGAENLTLDLKGDYQLKNLPGVLKAIELLQNLGWSISAEQLKSGLNSVVKNTGLKGRWQVLNLQPITICDTGHNIDGVKVLIEQMKTLTYEHLYLVLGFVDDKLVEEILALFPKKAHYIFCQSKVPRAMPLDTLRTHAENLGIEGDYIADVNEAVAVARTTATENDMVFIGGSTFVVAELNDL